ncbi:hypothetical protein FQN54_008151 [Arachnomyces sp. PD_36]|nr:hypothetical protein FQN54_008151 [Arachnomyces sp. PD_36]
MGVLLITLQDKEKVEKSGMVATHPEAISRVRDSLRLLEQLGTAEAAKLLDRVKTSGLNPPSFVFQSHDGSGSQTNTLCDEELPVQLPLATSLNNWATGAQTWDDLTMFDASPNEPPVDTINPALLSLSESDWEALIPGNDVPSNAGSSGTIDKKFSLLEAENSSLFVSPTDDIPTRPGTADGEKSPEDEDTDSPSTSFGSSDLIMGLPTPRSDPPSPATQAPMKTNHRRSKSKQCKVTKVTVARKKSVRKKSWAKHNRVEKQPESAGLEEPSVSTSSSPARNALCGLSDPDLQQALEVGEGLIRDGLSEHQDSCIWQESLWSEDALNLSILTGSSAEERFCQVFRYVNTLVTRSSDQKLRLRISHALLYLSFESLTQGNRSGIHSGRLENPNQDRAATLSADYLLKRSYPDKWESTDDQIKKSLRRQLHEQKRQGSRCWRMACGLGLGALLACGDTLARVIKNHSKYPLPKLDAIINYVVNAHPGVVSLYHEFDAVVKQILLGEPLTTQPTRQMIDDGIHRAAVTKLTLKKIEENWQQIDPASDSQKLIEEFVSNYA